MILSLGNITNKTAVCLRKGLEWALGSIFAVAKVT